MVRCSTDPLALQTRRDLGLPVDRAVMLSGHQAGLWHAGILAKADALAAGAAKLGAARAWLVVDQDHNEFATLRVPVRPAGGALAEAGWTIAPRAVAERVGADVPTALVPAFAPEPVPEAVARDAAGPGTRAGLERVTAALRRHAGAASAAAQLAGAALELAGYAEMTRVYATKLAASAGFQFLLARLRADPAGAAGAYNAAVAAHPEAGLAPLSVTPGGPIEVPLWIIRPGSGRRARCFAADLETVRAGELAPRALMQTAFCRMFLCDLFIHGTGGAGLDGQGGYDAVTAGWTRGWLGRELAPVATVTATLRLPLSERAAVSEAQVRRAAWLAHRAGHDPALVAEAGAGLMKQTLGRLAADRRRPHADRERLFARLRELLSEVEQFNAGRIERFRLGAEELRRQHAEDRLPADRTWPFPWHDDGARGALRGAFVGAFAEL